MGTSKGQIIIVSRQFNFLTFISIAQVTDWSNMLIIILRISRSRCVTIRSNYRATTPNFDIFPLSSFCMVLISLLSMLSLLHIKPIINAVREMNNQEENKRQCSVLIPFSLKLVRGFRVPEGHYCENADFSDLACVLIQYFRPTVM